MKSHCYLSKKCFAIILFLIFFDPALKAQQIPFTPVEDSIITLLKKDTTSILSLSLYPSFNFGITGYKVQTFSLVKAKNNTYLLVQGTNWLYLYNDSSHLFHRIDTTFYRGSNFDFYPFYYHDTLYQYGGYGFWSYRDFLSYYIERTKDWEFVPSSRFIQNSYTEHRIFWVDQNKGVLYVDGYLAYNQDRINNSVLIDSIYKYDIASKNWEGIGKLNPILLDRGHISSVCEMPQGVLCRIYNDFYLASFKENKLIPMNSTLNNALYVFYDHQISGYGMNQRNLISFYQNDTLYFILGKNEKCIVTRYKLTNNDFNQTHSEKLYYPYSSSSKFWLWVKENILFLLIILSLLIILWVVSWKRKSLLIESHTKK